MYIFPIVPRGRFLLFGNREKKRFAGEASYSSVSGRSSHSPPPPPRSPRSHRIMEMRLAPILILYYFPAEFSRHLYDNAKKIFPSPEKNPSGVAATPRPRIILPPPRSITLASLPNRAHLPPPSLPHCLSSRIRVVGIARRSRFSSSPSPSIFFAAPPITETDDTVAPPLPAAPSIFSPRLSDIRIFLSMPAPSHTLPRISPCSSTTLDLRRSQISAQNVERRKFTSGARDTGRERERDSFVQAKSLLRFLDSSRWTSASFSLLPSLRNLINRDSLLLDIGFRCPAFDRPFRDLRTRSCEKSDEKFCPAARRRRDFFPRETIPPAIIRPIGVALILCAIKRFINRADKFGNNRGRGRCLRVTSMRGRSISGNRVDRLLAVKGDGARRIGSCSAATPVGTQRQR